MRPLNLPGSRPRIVRIREARPGVGAGERSRLGDTRLEGATRLPWILEAAEGRVAVRRDGEAAISYSPVWVIARYRPGEDPDDRDSGRRDVLAEFWCWDDFIEWVGSLPDGSYPALTSFARDWEAADSRALIDELSRAFRTDEPTNLWVRRVAERLLGVIGDGDPEETVMIEGP
jgi:hypothetical protein